MELLRHQDRAVVPWKNGGGVTREIAVRLDGADTFLWRVSIATVAMPGPFSRFEGIDRTIAVLEGAGIVLHGRESDVTLTRGSEPYAFDGETPIEASVIDGETTDLNVMTKRGCFSHAMERRRLDRTAVLEGEADETILVFNSDMTGEIPAGPFSARRFDALKGIARGDRIHLFPDADSEVFVIRLTRMPVGQ